ncbi:MAG: cellulase family glycosylhydrolase [Phycisphaerae bacterium]|nr:cellulase family glycosylhydrolase [Phycisphaerae bacterium]
MNAMRARRVLRLSAAVVVVFHASSGLGEEPSRFLRRQGSELLLQGKPLRLVSVNKFDLFLQSLDGGQKRQWVSAVEEAAQRGFTAIRFAGVGFYPSNMRNWSNEKVYWGRFDELVRTAKANGVYLIPTIHWNTYLFPDMAGECVQDMLLEADSRSRQYLWLYTYQIVTRYKDEPTILFWELTNEMNLHADLAFQRPYGYGQLNPVHEGTSYMRLRRDHFTSEQMIGFVKEWAGFIRSLDKNHLIGSGFSAPRPAAQHLRLSCGKGDWTKDNEGEMETYLRDTHPDPIDLISIHYYPGHDNVRLGNKDEVSVAPIAAFKRACDRIGKPMYLGETGYGMPLSAEAPFVRQMLGEVGRLEVPLTLMWNWMSPGRERNIDPQETPRVVTLMQEANGRFGRSGDRGQGSGIGGQGRIGASR